MCAASRSLPSIDLASEVANNPEATTFCLAPGVYRISQPLTLKHGPEADRGGSGKTIISGAKTVSATKEGAYWVITGQTSLGQSAFPGRVGQCRPVQWAATLRGCASTGTRCSWTMEPVAGRLAQRAFLRGVLLGLRGEPDLPGRRPDREEARALGRRAAGSRVAPGWRSGISPWRSSAISAQTGAISASSGWLIEGVEVRLNHGAGIHMGPGTVVRGSFIHHNGQLGIHGGQPSCAGAKGLLLENSELSYNNTAGYNWGWEGGATKWTNTDGLIVRNNLVHDNYGMGLWTDGFNINMLYTDNVVRDNDGMGIDHELGYAAVIRDNVVTGNGFQHPIKGDVWGAGIFIDQSRDVRDLRQHRRGQRRRHHGGAGACGGPVRVWHGRSSQPLRAR